MHLLLFLQENVDFRGTDKSVSYKRLYRLIFPVGHPAVSKQQHAADRHYGDGPVQLAGLGQTVHHGIVRVSGQDRVIRAAGCHRIVRSTGGNGIIRVAGRDRVIRIIGVLRCVGRIRFIGLVRRERGRFRLRRVGAYLRAGVHLVVPLAVLRHGQGDEEGVDRLVALGCLGLHH